MKATLKGWHITEAGDGDWMPWGSDDNARAKVIGQADGYSVTLVEADAGYRGTPHEHAYSEFFYLLDGSIRNQGQHMKTGDAYAAAAGSVHDDFEAECRSTYLIIFRL